MRSPFSATPTAPLQATKQPVAQFKDSKGAIKRQAARFRVYVYDDHSPAGRELKIGETIQVIRAKSGQTYTGTVADITVDRLPGEQESQLVPLRPDERRATATKPSHPLRNASADRSPMNVRK